MKAGQDKGWTPEALNETINSAIASGQITSKIANGHVSGGSRGYYCL